MPIYERYNDIPIQCRICKYFLQDEGFIKVYGSKFGCTFDDVKEVDPDFIEPCGEFKIGKWQLMEFLKFHCEIYHKKMEEEVAEVLNEMIKNG